MPLLPPVELLDHPILRVRCTICGELLFGHLRCRDCTILVGPGHIYTAVDSSGRCQACAAFLRRRLGLPRR